MSSDPRDYKLDLSSSPSARAGDPAPAAGPGRRPYLSVHFRCCNVYLRVYRGADGKTYLGRCPRCGVPVRFTVGDGGSDARFFMVT